MDITDRSVAYNKLVEQLYLLLQSIDKRIHTNYANEMILYKDKTFEEASGEYHLYSWMMPKDMSDKVNMVIRHVSINTDELLQVEHGILKRIIELILQTFETNDINND
jgi:hypothetical protein